jgi:large subunit ribosomal protein L25
METVEVEALPKDLPDVLTFSGESIVEAGDQATVADLKVPAGVTILTDENQVLATAHEPSALQAANEALEGEGEEPGAAEAEAEEGAIATEGEASAEAPAAEAETAKKTEE